MVASAYVASASGTRLATSATHLEARGQRPVKSVTTAPARARASVRLTRLSILSPSREAANGIEERRDLRRVDDDEHDDDEAGEHRERVVLHEAGVPATDALGREVVHGRDAIHCP